MEALKLFLYEICGLGVMAALRWTATSKARQLARLSWFCLFVAPIALFLIPVVPLMDEAEFAGNPQGAIMMSTTFGFMYFLTLAPKLIGLFPAVIGSSLTLKSLLPESPMPGWIAVVVAPLYALFFIVLVAVQIGDFLLVVSMGGLAAAPVMIVLGRTGLCSRLGRRRRWRASVMCGRGLEPRI